MRLSMSFDLYCRFYTLIAEVEPIFHLESLANAFDDSHPEKKYFLFLVGLGRAHLFSIFDAKRTIPYPEEFASDCRQRLSEILDFSRCVLSS